MKNYIGATLVEFIASMAIAALLITMFLHTFTTIFIIHTKEITREKADTAAVKIMEEILSYAYDDLLLVDSPPGAGTSYDYPGNPITIDDRDTISTADDVTAQAVWTVVQRTDPDGGNDYKDISLMLTWNEMIPGSEGGTTGFKTEILTYDTRRYADAQY